MKILLEEKTFIVEHGESHPLGKIHQHQNFALLVFN